MATVVYTQASKQDFPCYRAHNLTTILSGAAVFSALICVTEMVGAGEHLFAC